MLYRQKVPLPLNHALINPSDSTTQPVTTSSLTTKQKMQPYIHTQQMHMKLEKQSKITFKIRKNKFKKHSITKKPVIMRNKNCFNFK